MHIGKLIRHVANEKGISAIQFAQLLKVERNTIYSIYRKESINTALLTNISLALNHNFFTDLSEDINRQK